MHAVCQHTWTRPSQDWPDPCPAQTTDTEFVKALPETNIQAAKRPQQPTQPGGLGCRAGMQSGKAFQQTR